MKADKPHPYGAETEPSERCADCGCAAHLPKVDCPVCWNPCDVEHLKPAPTLSPERTLTRGMSRASVVEAITYNVDEPLAAELLSNDAFLRDDAEQADHDRGAVEEDLVRSWAEREQQRARADKAEADLATAMEALREIADFAHCDAEGFIVQPCPCPLCALSLRIAREALARIEVKK